MSIKKLTKQLKIKNPKLNQSEIENILIIFSEDVQDILKRMNSLEIRGFGRWYFKELNENYNARNPSTGETIYLPKRFKLRFRPAKKLKEIINL